jgi:hypothetical protein
VRWRLLRFRKEELILRISLRNGDGYVRVKCKTYCRDAAHEVSHFLDRRILSKRINMKQVTLVGLERFSLDNLYNRQSLRTLRNGDLPSFNKLVLAAYLADQYCEFQFFVYADQNLRLRLTK